MNKKQNVSTRFQQMFRTRLYLRSEADSDGFCIVYIYINLNGKVAYLDTGIRVERQHWNEKERVILGTHPNGADYNLILMQSIAKLNQIAIDARLHDRILTIDALRKSFYAADGFQNFIIWARKEISDREREMIASSTIKMHQSIINKLAEYCKEQLAFHEIDANYIAKYEKWLSAKKGNSINTINKNMKVLRLYFNRAMREGMMKHTPFETHKMKRERTTPDCLTEKDLDKAFEVYFSMPSGTKKDVLRAFLFACCTGLRISDIRRIAWSNVISKTLVFSVFKIRNQAPATIKVPLTKTAQQLMRDTGTFTGQIFDLTGTDTYVNKVLKQALVAIASKKIHFHTARHTFATHYLRKNKRDIVTLKTLLGHSKIEQTMTYLTIDDEWLQEGMANFGEWI